jgi:hypothetical protein
MKHLLTVTGCIAALLAAFSFGVSAAELAAAPAAVACADPAADIELALVSKTGAASGRVRVTGVVKNIGTATWSAAPGHYLQMVLAMSDSAAQPQGKPVAPPIAIRQLSPGQQFRIDHQMDWDASVALSYPRFVVMFSEAGQGGTHSAQHSTDCRADNNRKEITPADIQKLFMTSVPSSKSIVLQSYRLLGGRGINTVEATLVYNRTSPSAGKITAAVAAPYSGTADETLITGNTGTARIQVHIPCDSQHASAQAARPVEITYRLWGSFILPGGSSSWVAGMNTVQSIAYSELCGIVRNAQSSRTSSR